MECLYRWMWPKVQDFSQWNDATISGMFIRLMTKTNHPYDTKVLSELEFDIDYDTMNAYIKWKTTNYDDEPNQSDYNFSPTHMAWFLEQIKYTSNIDELNVVWQNSMIKL